MFAVAGGVLSFVLFFILLVSIDFTPEPTFVAGTPYPVLIPFPVPVEVPVAYPARIDAIEELGAFSDPAGEFYCFPVDGAGF